MKITSRVSGLVERLVRGFSCLFLHHLEYKETLFWKKYVAIFLCRNTATQQQGHRKILELRKCFSGVVQGEPETKLLSMFRELFPETKDKRKVLQLQLNGIKQRLSKLEGRSIS